MLENVIKVGRLFIEWKFVASSLEKNRPGQGQLARGRYRLAEFDNKDFIPLLADPPPPANAMS